MVRAETREALRAPVGLALALVVAYAVSLPGGFLNYDDPWLIRDNPLLRDGSPGALRAIWTDLGERTRLVLGAEYLPVRDTSLWLEARLHGLSPRALRVTNLLLFVAAALALRAYLLRTLPDRRAAEWGAWLFALHPVHAESAAWLAGRKDVLALLFVALALGAYASPRPRAALAVPGLLVLAALGKGVAVVAPLLLLLHDLFVGRRPRWAVVGLSLAGAAAVLAVHVRVGATVQMFAPLAGGSRLAAAATMGPVWLRYLGLSFVPVGLSVHQEVAVRAASDGLGWLAYVPLAAAAAGAAFAWRRGSRPGAFALGWFVVPLLPTSQVLAPLQNLMADRYLLLAVLGPCLLMGTGLARTRPAVATLVLAGFGALTAGRAYVFADSVRLWQDALDRSPTAATPAYQLAMAHQEAGDEAAAEAAFRLAMARAPEGDDTGRMASNNLAALLIRTGRLDEAHALLTGLVARFPEDPRALNNLAEVTARRGDAAEAQRLFEEVVRRFPGYEPGRRNLTRRYGVPIASPAD